MDMRKIEKEMVSACLQRKTWRNANTNTVFSGDTGAVYLHDNRIATITGNLCIIDRKTLAQWPTRTTKSRVKALLSMFQEV
jgi:hypothetical protein